MYFSATLLAPLALSLCAFVQGPTPPTIPAVEVGQVYPIINGDPSYVEMEIRTPHWQPSHDLMMPNMHFVVLPLNAGPAAEPLVMGVTDSEGAATIQVPLDAVNFRNDGSVWANVFLREEGKQSRRASHLRKKNHAGGRANRSYRENLMSIDIRDGCTQHARTVDLEGNPIATRLQVRDSRDEAKAYNPRRARRFAYRNLGDGWHAIHYAESLQIQGSARFTGVGTGSFSDLALDCARRRELLEIVLQGEGVLQGTVVDQNGKPTPGVPLSFKKSGVIPYSKSSQPGHNSGHATTDQKGQFRIKGLQPGKYVARCTDPDASLAVHDLLADRSFDANGEHIRLPLPRICLQIKLLSSSGGPWKGVEPHSNMRRDWYRSQRPNPAEYPAGPILIVAPIGEALNANLTGDKRLSWSRVQHDTYAFRVENGKEYWVGAIGGNFPLGFQKIKIDKDQEYTNISLREVEQHDLGTVKLQAMKDYGSRVFGVSPADTRTWIESVPEGIHVLESSFWYATIHSKLPAGRYRIVAQGTSAFRACGNSPHNPRDLGFADMIIDLKKGETLDLKPALKQGALLEVSVRAKEDITIGSLPVLQGEYLDRRSRTQPYAQLHLEHASRRAVRVPHFPREGHPHRSPTAAWPLNETITSERLPYGDYTLVITLCDGQVQRHPIELHSGKTTAITVQF
ncbi:MAG: hypothetical protein ACI9X4_002857 [Glaciecola sp.]|jgi:hypothetical protein